MVWSRLLGVKSAKVKRISRLGTVRKRSPQEKGKIRRLLFWWRFFSSGGLRSVGSLHGRWKNPFPSLYLNRTDRKRGTKAKDNNDKCRLFNQRKSARVTVVIINWHFYLIPPLPLFQAKILVSHFGYLDITLVVVQEPTHDEYYGSLIMWPWIMWHSG